MKSQALEMEQEVFPDKDRFAHIFYEGTATEYRQAIQKALDCVGSFLQNTRKPFSGIKPAVLKKQFDRIDLNAPLENYDQVFDEVQRLYVDHATAFHLPEYIAHLNCPVLIPALAAEILVSAINSSQDTYDQSAGGTFIERKVLEWTGQQIGYDGNCDGIFTAGGSQSNLMGLLLARDHYALRHLKHSVKTLGNPPEASGFRIFVSDQSHFSNQKNAAMLGLGEQAIVKVKTDHEFRMDSECLEDAIIRELQEGNLPIAVVATAGTTDFGNLDPLNAIAQIAAKYSIWMHVDAAYGCGLLLSDKYGYLLRGIEQADSITVDYHKSFFQPISSSAFLVKNHQDLLIIKHHADYLNPSEQDYEELPAQINKSVTQSTRRFDALKLWFTLRLTGRQKLGEYTDTMIETTRTAARLIRSDKAFELLNDSDLGTLVFRCLPTGNKPTDICALNQYIKKTLFFSGEVLVASTRVKGEFYLKFTIINPLTTEHNIRNILQKIKSHGKSYEHTV